MRSKEEQLAEIRRRSEIIRERNKNRKYAVIETAVSLVCVVLLFICLGISVPAGSSSSNMISNYGSLILSNSHLTYAVTAVLAFIAGIMLALACVHWKKYRK